MLRIVTMTFKTPRPPIIYKNRGMLEMLGSGSLQQLKNLPRWRAHALHKNKHDRHNIHNLKNWFSGPYVCHAPGGDHDRPAGKESFKQPRPAAATTPVDCERGTFPESKLRPWVGCPNPRMRPRPGPGSRWALYVKRSGLAERLPYVQGGRDPGRGGGDLNPETFKNETIRIRLTGPRNV